MISYGEHSREVEIELKIFLEVRLVLHSAFGIVIFTYSVADCLTLFCNRGAVGINNNFFEVVEPRRLIHSISFCESGSHWVFYHDFISLLVEGNDLSLVRSCHKMAEGKGFEPSPAF